jgi:hypothetical protein
MAELIRLIPDAKFGICHGARNGYEVAQFKSYLPHLEIIGTDISKTATRFPHMIVWDFHEIKPEWINAVDFIYSNSLDHSYDPPACVAAWMRCIKANGICFIHWGAGHNKSKPDATDCFSATVKEYSDLLCTKHFSATDTLQQDDNTVIFVVRHR